MVGWDNTKNPSINYGDNPGATVVVGLGMTGLSCVRYLVHEGVSVTVMDDRLSPPGLVEVRASYPDVVTVLGGYDSAMLKNANTIILSPGVSQGTPEISEAITCGARVIGDIEIFSREAKAPIIAITGSNGKSTVATLVGEVIKSAGFSVKVGGNIGVPALDLLEGEVPDWYVLELSSFQLETTHSLSASCATVLNLCEDHLDRYADLNAYKESKQRIYKGAKTIVANRSGGLVSGNNNVKYFGLGSIESADFSVRTIGGESWVVKGDEQYFSLSEIRLIGRHNVENILAVMAIAESVGLKKEAVVAAVKQFPGLDHRTQLVAEINNVRWVNDSKGTNVGATVAALEGIDGSVVLIAGGVGKGADFSPLKNVVAKKCSAVVLIGRDSIHIENALEEVVPIFHAVDMSAAVSCANKEVNAGGVVLLSPACASFDMYESFVKRGEDFIAEVQRIKG